MKLETTSLAGLSVATTDRLQDRRGSFARLFCDGDLQPALLGRRVVQINHSITSQVGAIRGMHYQHAPAAEMKLIRCIRGRVLDVAVDIRRTSSTFLQWHAVELSKDNMKLAILSEGFAHGFQVLEADSELLYLHTAHYTPSTEGALNPLDPRLNIGWPLPVSDISDRDRGHAFLTDAFAGVVL